MRIYLVRHGQTEWNLEKRWQGSKDISLNKTGFEQAERLGKRFENHNIERIYVSTLSRARQTAETIQKYTKATLSTEEDLKEIMLGKWEGLTYAEVINNYKSDFDRWEQKYTEDVGHGVENYKTLQNRAFGIFDKICNENTDDIIIVSHGAWIRALICKLLNIPLEDKMSFEIENVGITIIEFNKSKYVVKTLNDTSHI